MKNSPYCNIDKIKVTKKSHNDTQRVYGEVIFYINGSDANEVESLSELYIKQGGEYRITPYKFKANVCEIIEHDEVFMPSFRKFIEPTLGKTCNKMYAGTYKINGYKPDMSLIPPVLRSGDYKADLKYLRHGIVVQHYEVFLHLINIKGGYIGL